MWLPSEGRAYGQCGKMWRQASRFPHLLNEEIQDISLSGVETPEYRTLFHLAFSERPCDRPVTQLALHQQIDDIRSDLALCFSGIALWRIVDKTTRFGFPRKPEPLPLNPREPIQRHDLTLLPLNR